MAEINSLTFTLNTAQVNELVDIARAWGMWRKIQYSVLPEPAKESITTAPGLRGPRLTVAAMS